MVPIKSLSAKKFKLTHWPNHFSLAKKYEQASAKHLITEITSYGKVEKKQTTNGKIRIDKKIPWLNAK